MPVQSQHRKVSRPISRPDQPPPPPPREAGRNPVLPGKSKKPAPPLPSKPPHLLRNSLTPPPKPGNISSLLAISSYSLPDYELSSLEPPQLSSTLNSLANKSQAEAGLQPTTEPLRSVSTRQGSEPIEDIKASLSNLVLSAVSLEESFSTRFKPLKDFPVPDIFTNCEKSYPSKEQGNDARNSTDEQIALACNPVVPDRDKDNEEEQSQAFEPSGDQTPPPLPKTPPPNHSYTMASNSKIGVSKSIPTPPPLPTGNVVLEHSMHVESQKDQGGLSIELVSTSQTNKASAVSPAPPIGSSIPTPPPFGSIVPPPPPLPSTGSHPHQINKVEAQPLVSKSKDVITSEDVNKEASPISVKKIAMSGFAVNLSKLYCSNQTARSRCHDEPNKPPLLGKKPSVVSSGLKVAPSPPQRPISLKMKSPTHSGHRSPPKVPSVKPSTAIPTKTRCSPPCTTRAAPPPPMAPPRTSSLSSIPQDSPPPAQHAVPAHKQTQNPLSRSQSFRSAPPPPVPAPHAPGYVPSLDRSRSLRTSAPIFTPHSTLMGSPRRADASQPDSIRRKFSFRAAPPPPVQHNPSESSTMVSNRHSGPPGAGTLQSPKILIC